MKPKIKLSTHLLRKFTDGTVRAYIPAGYDINAELMEKGLWLSGIVIGRKRDV